MILGLGHRHQREPSVLSQKGTRRRPGIGGRPGYVNIVELLFVLPLLLVLLLAMAEFSMILTTQTRLAAAARDGAREAATGGSPRQVRQAVQRVLGEEQMRHARVLIRPEYDEEAPLLPGEAVEVRVELDAKGALPDLLSFAGFSLRGKRFIGQAIMRVE